MTAQDLKNSVLQLAVQGKLVPQNPEDEPAAALLEKIRAEKKRLAKEKKIKAEKIKIEPVERRGNYIFIKSNLPGNECCGRCALCYSKEGCFPCRQDEGHENGYWRYSQPMTM